MHSAVAYSAADLLRDCLSAFAEAMHKPEILIYLSARRHIVGDDERNIRRWRRLA